MGQKKRYFGNLDGLRAIAAIIVIFFHLYLWIGIPNDYLQLYLTFDYKGGRLSVYFFLILSGFLITYLLYAEQSKMGRINIYYFFLRRCLRIWPLYFLTVAIGFFLYPFILHLLGKTHTETASLPMYLCFLVNFDHIYNNSGGTGILGVQWTVAIEEQFYLIWPFLFLFINKRKIFPFLLIALTILSQWYYMKTQSTMIGKYHFFAVFRFISFGCFLAYLCFNHLELVKKVLGYLNRPLTFLIYLASLLMMFYNHHIQNVLFNEMVIFCFFGFVIVEQNYSSASFFKVGDFKVLDYLGKISYGLYLYHMMAIYIVIGLFPPGTLTIPIKFAMVFALTILISHISFYYYESYFLNLKEKYFSPKALD